MQFEILVTIEKMMHHYGIFFVVNILLTRKILFEKEVITQ